MPKRASLVCQHLENVSREALEEYQDIIRQYVRGREGIYALYRRGKLYYVGLASNLRNRLRAHLKGPHGESWDRFSVYLTAGETHLKELEALILRIVRPKGNRVAGKFAKSENLRSRLRRGVWAYLRRHTEDMLGQRPRLAGSMRGSLKAKPRRGGRRPSLAGVFPRAVPLKGRHKGEVYRGRLRTDGLIRHSGRLYRSPSAAATAACHGPKNGWLFWHFESAPGRWAPLRILRR